MNRRLTLILIVALMAGFGVGVNRFLALNKTNLDQQKAGDPTKVVPAFALPGTIYVAQQGQLYRFREGHFVQLTSLPAKDAGNTPWVWQQPVVLGNGSLIAVARSLEFSEFYNVDENGKVIQQLTKNYRGNDPNTIRSDHWVAWPHLSPDGASLFYSIDSPKDGYSYEVDFNIWSTPLNGTLIAQQNATPDGVVRGTHWTTPNYYTGGDTDSIPLKKGGLMYVTYAVGGDGKVSSTLVLQANPTAKVVPLTTPDSNCNAATLSPDELHVAMLCTTDHALTQLNVATFDGKKLGTPTVVVGDCLCASPQWAPDGKSLVYLAPNDAKGHFQLWWLDKATLVTHGVPKQVTSTLDLDATSTPAWTALTQ